MIIKRGKDIVSSLISKVPVELHMRTLKGKKYSFCGPNTNLKERLDSDGDPKTWSKPINKVDEVCLRHDKAYDEGIITQHEADKQMLDELSNLKSKDLNWNEWFARNFTQGIIGLKYKLGLGQRHSEAKEVDYLEEVEELHLSLIHI